MAYDIKPLKWKRQAVAVEYWSAEVDGFGYDVFRLSTGHCLWLHTGIKDKPCKSIEDGKAKAEAHWKRKIRRCLVVAA